METLYLSSLCTVLELAQHRPHLNPANSNQTLVHNVAGSKFMIQTSQVSRIVCKTHAFVGPHAHTHGHAIVTRTFQLCLQFNVSG